MSLSRKSSATIPDQSPLKHVLKSGRQGFEVDFKRIESDSFDIKSNLSSSLNEDNIGIYISEMLRVPTIAILFSDYSGGKDNCFF